MDPSHDLTESDTSTRSEGLNSLSEDTKATSASLASSVSADSVVILPSASTIQASKSGELSGSGQNSSQATEQVTSASVL